MYCLQTKSCLKSCHLELMYPKRFFAKVWSIFISTLTSSVRCVWLQVSLAARVLAHVSASFLSKRSLGSRPARAGSPDSGELHSKNYLLANYIEAAVADKAFVSTLPQ